ncbi:unnamed protein product [Miscanthus lutarioriparius]|uniref:Uncharacterized protein n=1 Tax=Miscanthus lutarioriparius TaxID=422564 RepID=A0A811PYD7_9POAL|nr:unnamed protein product [Miscanthus lutarioriparius]
MEREIAASRMPLPPPPWGPNAWSAARKTSASNAPRPSVHLLLMAIVGSTLEEGAVAGRAQVKRKRS